MSISIIVPVLNEAALIRELLEHLRNQAASAEIIVVDGMSSDNTAELAEALCDRLIRVTPGRGRQLNAGGRIASGDILWFLHADVRISTTAVADMAHALQDSRVVGGFFRIRIARADFVYRLTDSLAHYLGVLLGIRYGDHGFFCRREIFKKIGGFPDVALMEDADFYRKLRRVGRTAVISEPIVVSPRRYELIGRFRLTFAYGLISLLYFLRVPRSVLESIYGRACCRSRLLGLKTCVLFSGDLWLIYGWALTSIM